MTKNRTNGYLTNPDFLLSCSSFHILQYREKSAQLAELITLISVAADIRLVRHAKIAVFSMALFAFCKILNNNSYLDSLKTKANIKRNIFFAIFILHFFTKAYISKNKLSILLQSAVPFYRYILFFRLHDYRCSIPVNRFSAVSAVSDEGELWQGAKYSYVTNLYLKGHMEYPDYYHLGLCFAIMDISYGLNIRLLSLTQIGFLDYCLYLY